MVTGFKNELPKELVSHVTAGCGRSGVEWLSRLPQTLAHLERLWSVEVAEPFPGVEFNFVAPAVTSDGKDAVVKIAPPWEPVEIFGEAEYLRFCAGPRCARLLAVDRSSRALLIERIFSGRNLAELFTGREADALTPAIDVLLDITASAPADAKLPKSLDDWFDGLRAYSGTEFPAEYAERALRIYDRLSSRPGGGLYLHGDYHPGNIVDSDENGYMVIDPKGITGHVGYDISVFLNNFGWWQEKKPGLGEALDKAVTRFSAAFDMSEIEIREWAFAGMVLGAWWNYKDMPDLYDGEVVKADVWGI